MFKVGDKVKRYSDCSGTLSGKVYTVEEYEGWLKIGEKDPDGSFVSGGCSCTEAWELVEEYKLTNKTMNIKEKFILALTAEPKKSFRKAGITDGDDMLTSEGQGVFLNWLLHSVYSEQFKKEVIDSIIKEEEKK